MTFQIASEGIADLLGSVAAADGPGLAAGVYRNGDLVAWGAAGLATVEHGVPIDANTMFDIASASKHMTTSCLLLLVREGRLALDVDVRDLLPELCLTVPVTLRQCLSHTGGLRDYLELMDIAGIPLAGLDEEAAMAIVAGQCDLDFAPGTSYSYSNSGYLMAAAIVRRITGESLTDFAASRLFGPLGTPAMHFRADKRPIVAHLANGYSLYSDICRKDGAFGRDDPADLVVGDGAVTTSLAAMAGWHRFMATGDVLGSDIRDGLFARQALADGRLLEYALGIVAVTIPEAGPAGPGWWHGGAINGFRSNVLYVPSQGLGVTVLANRDDLHPGLISMALARAALTGRSPRECYDAISVPPAAPADAREALRLLAGRWHDAERDAFLDISDAGDGTMVDHDGYRYRLGTDGIWHGLGVAQGATWTLRGDVLDLGEQFGEWVDGHFRRARADTPSPVDGPAPTSTSVPAGEYHCPEMNVRAHVAPDRGHGGGHGDSGGDGAIVVRIGGAKPRRLTPTAGAWAGGGLTVRPAGSGLLVSADRLRRLRFDRA